MRHISGKAIANLGSQPPRLEIAHDRHVRRGPPPGVRLGHFVRCLSLANYALEPRNAGHALRALAVAAPIPAMIFR